MYIELHNTFILEVAVNAVLSRIFHWNRRQPE